MGGRGLFALCTHAQVDLRMLYAVRHNLYDPDMATPPGTLTDALNALWSGIRDNVERLPAVRVAISPTRVSTNHGSHRWRKTEDGHVSGLVIDAGTLRQGPLAVLTAILHDAAHIICWQDGTQDTATRGRYHNGNYAVAASIVGLELPGGPARGVGYAHPAPTPATEALYADHLRALRPAIDAELRYLPTEDPTPRSTQLSRVAIACQCSPPRRGWMSATVLERGPVCCGVCDAEFLPADE